MPTLKLCLVLILISVIPSWSQITKVETPGPSGIKFKSKIDSIEYVVYIQLPEDYAKSDKKYPVLYVTDGQWFFNSVLQAYYGQHYDGFVPDLIIIGITWTGDYESSRGRDFTPTQLKGFQQSGNAPRFLSVVKNEIISYIDSTYRTDKSNRALYGTSLGGTFALYTLFKEPTLFNRYIIISPSLWVDNELAFKDEKDFAKKNRVLNAKIFLSSGEYEEAIYPGNTFNRFCDQLKASNYKGLELESSVLEKMSHSASATAGACRGIQSIYSKPELLIDTSILDQYTGTYEQGLIVSRKENSLYVSMFGGNVKLYAETPESFYVKGLSGTGQFKKDDKGKVIAYYLVQNNNTMTFKKIK